MRFGRIRPDGLAREHHAEHEEDHGLNETEKDLQN
jgi:hypothetical protein